MDLLHPSIIQMGEAHVVYMGVCCDFTHFGTVEHLGEASIALAISIKR